MNHKEHEDHKDDESRIPPIPPATEGIVRVIIGAGIDVHGQLGPGFLEPVYERALCVELGRRGLRVEPQKIVPIHYRGVSVSRHRLDLVIEGVVIVEVKAVRRLRPIHQAQILSYLKASGCRVGLLMNFNVPALVQGIRRYVR